MGEERLTDNPNATPMNKNTVESYTIQIQRIITGLHRFDDDPRASDAAAVLQTAIAVMTGEPYDAAVQEAVAVQTSPGKDDEGNPLPPFAPMLLPGPGNMSYDTGTN